MLKWLTAERKGFILFLHLLVPAKLRKHCHYFSLELKIVLLLTLPAVRFTHSVATEIQKGHCRIGLSCRPEGKITTKPIGKGLAVGEIY